MTDEANSSVVLAELQVTLFRECNNHRLSLWGRPFSCSPVTLVVKQKQKHDCTLKPILNMHITFALDFVVVNKQKE